MPALTFNTYGKTRVRLMQVIDETPLEIDVTIKLEGDLEESYTAGDNSRVLPTDTMKNTVYVLARQHPIAAIEHFGAQISDHFLSRLPHIQKVNVEIQQTPWSRFGDGAFVQAGKELRIAHVTATRSEAKIVSGLRNLQILKTKKSAFADFLKDEYTTLPETHDRLFGTVLDADWQGGDYDEVRSVLLDAFAAHDSLSVQHTLYFMAEAVLNRVEAVKEIHLVMPNKHNLLFDLARFGLDNPNRIFVPTDEPSGYIEARITRP